MKSLLLLLVLAFLSSAPVDSAATVDSELARSILKDLQGIPVPERYDCTILYRRHTTGLSEEDVDTDPDMVGMRASHASESERRGPDDPFVRALAETSESFRAQLLKDDYLLQKQRIRVDLSKARYETLKDFGAPGDPESEEKADAARGGRSGIYFTDGNNATAAAVYKSRSLVEFLPCGVYYPSLPGLVRPTFFPHIEEMLQMENVQSSVTRTGNTLVAKYGFPKGIEIEIAVDPLEGMKLLYEKNRKGEDPAYEKKLEGFKRFGRYWLPTRVEITQGRTTEVIEFESIEVDADIDPEVFDCRKEFRPGMRVVDCRVSPSIQYRLKEEDLEDIASKVFSDLSDLSAVAEIASRKGGTRVGPPTAANLVAGPPDPYAGIVAQSSEERKWFWPVCAVCVLLSLSAIASFAISRRRKT
ncbi:hypothetical protein JW916_12875 [Candidatus Sumerlaeota bacterium]|nr:hypothetical protein [Candidatus Sumerlaeota bacterium]